MYLIRIEQIPVKYKVSITNYICKEHKTTYMICNFHIICMCMFLFCTTENYNDYYIPCINLQMNLNNNIIKAIYELMNQTIRTSLSMC